MPVIYHENKPPTYICQDCGLKFTHFSDNMLILKDYIWLSIAKKEDVLCDSCISNRLKKPVELCDLWVNENGITSCINDWFVKYKQK